MGGKVGRYRVDDEHRASAVVLKWHRWYIIYILLGTTECRKDVDLLK